MATTAQHLLGQLVDGQFPLRRLLGVSQNSAVFLTDLPNPRPSEPAPEAALKLIPEDQENSARQLERWRAAASLSHPGLLRIHSFGRCSVDGASCLYVVTELASENLGDLLPQRPLTPEEASGMLTPVMATLDFLHEKGLIHAGLKPSNVLAVRDTIKISPDRILPAGESAAPWPLAAPYGPPESPLSPASDMWSLGVTLYETLTQYLPQKDSSGHYVLPQLASPYSDIIRAALVEDPAERITLDEVRSLLDPAFVPKPKPAPVSVAPPPSPDPASIVSSTEQAPPQQALAAAAQASAARAAVNSRSAQPVALPHVDPLSVPLSPVTPSAAPTQPAARIPVSSLPNVNASIGSSRRVQPAVPLEKKSSFGFFFMGAAGTLLLAILIVPRLLRNSSGASASSPVKTSALPRASAPAATPAPAGTSSSSSPKTKATAPAASASSRVNANGSMPPKTTPAPLSSDDSTVPEPTRKVLPEVSQKARSTIRGTVRINVRVQLNPDGTVSSVALDSPAASQFFADLALKAARQWQFVTSGETSALLRFDFTNTGTTATVAP